MRRAASVLLASVCLVGMAIAVPAAGAAPLLGPHTDYAVGSTPYSVTTADFDGDGNPDLATSNFYGNSVAILDGTGSGSFTPATPFATATGPNAVVSGDFNGDGHPDLAAPAYTSNSASILLNTGTGAMGTHSDYAAGTKPNSIATADFDGDGDLDLATVGYNIAPPNNPHLSVMLNSGSGSFAAPTNYTTGPGPQGVVSADFNGDGRADLATVNYDGDNVSVFLGTGSGSFGAKTDFGVGSDPLAITTADYNGDGKPDLATANASSDTVSVLLGTGTGSFGTKQDFPTGVTPSGVSSADLNGDGNQDLISANFNSNTISVFLGTGTGSFAAKQDFATATGTYSTASADFNHDGRPDVAVAAVNANLVSVLLGSGAPTATPSPSALSFGPRAINTASTSQAVTIANGGNARLAIGNTQLVGADPAEFEIRADGCSGQTLRVGASCEVWVRFAPDSTGAKQAQLRFTDNAPDSPQAVTLTGTGTPPPDTSPPDVFFTSGPAGLTNSRTPAYAFGMSEAGTFECRTDGGAFTACTSPTTLASLTDGPHVFDVRGTDSAGNSATAERTLLVDATPPETTLGPVPAKVVVAKKGKRAKLTFRFTASEPGATFACSIDRRAFAPCASPRAGSFGVGAHTFAVRATDAAGNTDPMPATARFKVIVKKKPKR